MKYRSKNGFNTILALRLSLKQNKVALNENDKEEFKRYICSSKINTLAHGYH